MPKKISNKRVTLEDLAAMVQQGFLEVDEKFETVHQDLAEFRNMTEIRFKSVENRLERIEHRMPEFGYQFEIVELDKRVTKLEQ